MCTELAAPNWPVPSVKRASQQGSNKTLQTLQTRDRNLTSELGISAGEVDYACLSNQRHHMLGQADGQTCFRKNSPSNMCGIQVSVSAHRFAAMAISSSPSQQGRVGGGRHQWDYDVGERRDLRRPDPLHNPVWPTPTLTPKESPGGRNGIANGHARSNHPATTALPRRRAHQSA
jgi:hypothetical protein